MKRKKRKRDNFNLSPAHASQGRIFGQTGGYLMGSIRYPFRNKWGISDATKLRRAQVDKDVAGAVYTIFGREILYGWVCEQFVHFIYQLQNAPMKKGTGRTEWYRTFNPIFGSAFIWGTWQYGLEVEWYWKGLAYLCPFIWIDGLLWLILFRLLGWAFCGVLLWAIVWVLRH